MEKFRSELFAANFSPKKPRISVVTKCQWKNDLTPGEEKVNQQTKGLVSNLKPELNGE